MASIALRRGVHCRVTVFQRPPYQGAGATVWLAETPIDAQRIQRFCSDFPDDTLCVAWPRPRGGHAIVSRCFKGGREIGFCGHGLLAVAWSWWQVNGAQPALVTSAGTYHSAWRDRRLWLRVPRIRTHTVTLPSAPAACFDAPPCAAALAGGERGYLILEWPSGMDLATLVPDFARLRRSGERAVIATQADRRQPWDYTLRYFAPQYGNDEDQATGSANVVLADYWSARLQRRRLLALQRSSAGGVVASRIDATAVELGGNVTLLTASAMDPNPPPAADHHVSPNAGESRA